MTVAYTVTYTQCNNMLILYWGVSRTLWANHKLEDSDTVEQKTTTYDDQR